ncbi:DNA (cytosine-5-)-methyltransferase [Myceligenerans halotolerans]
MGYSVVEICAGAGGQALGLERAGFEHALAVEIDDNAAATLQLNRPHWKVAIGDVADESVWTPEHYGGIALLAGGVPCPPFSIAGKQLGANDERDLFAWAVEACGRIQPRALMLENVRGLSMPRFAGYRQAVIDRLADLGYVADWKLLHASDYGVPQLRPRFVLVALREEDAPYFQWPEPHDRVVSVGEALHDLMAENGWEHASEWASTVTGVAPTIVGGSKKHGGADLGPTRAKKAWREMHVDGHGLADAAPPEGAPHFFEKPPRLTAEMAARLQGWGDGYEWKFTGRKTARYRQVGNAFPPPLAEAVGGAIFAALEHEREYEGTRELAAHAVHDDVYRALRGSEKFQSVPELRGLLFERYSESEILKRVDNLRRDFAIEERKVRGQVAYKLGGFNAFTGQDDHARHLAFAAAATRSRIS